MHTFPSHPIFFGLGHVSSSYQGLFSSIAKIPWVRGWWNNCKRYILSISSIPTQSDVQLENANRSTCTTVTHTLRLIFSAVFFLCTLHICSECSEHVNVFIYAYYYWAYVLVHMVHKWLCPVLAHAIQI